MLGNRTTAVHTQDAPDGVKIFMYTEEIVAHHNLHNNVPPIGTMTFMIR